MSGILKAVSLEGRHARLEPLQRERIEPLQRALADGELRKLWYTSVPTPADTEACVDAALVMQAQGTALLFAVRSHSSGEIMGSTRLCHAEARHRRVEIGYTWYAASTQRSAINTECKRLPLRHAFDTLHCIRVAFCTHWLNQRSRAAIARLVAKQDGIVRNHQQLADGSYCDTVIFSIIESEWPAVQRHLAFRLEQGDKA